MKSLTQKTKIWCNNALSRGLGKYSFTSSPSSQFSTVQLAILNPLEGKLVNPNSLGIIIIFYLCLTHQKSKIKNQKFNMIYVFRLHISQPHCDEITDQMLIRKTKRCNYIAYSSLYLD